MKNELEVERSVRAGWQILQIFAMKALRVVERFLESASMLEENGNATRNHSLRAR